MISFLGIHVDRVDLQTATDEAIADVKISIDQIFNHVDAAVDKEKKSEAKIKEWKDHPEVGKKALRKALLAGRKSKVEYQSGNKSKKQLELFWLRKYKFWAWAAQQAMKYFLFFFSPPTLD